MVQKLKLEELGRIDVETFKQSSKTPLVIVLDNVRSMHNVGAVFRTADAFLVEKILLCGITPQPEGYRVVGVEQTTGSQMITEFDFTKSQKYALVLGNEVEGISDEVLPLCDDFMEIPQLGTKHSLNVSVCGGIVMWEFFKHLK